MYGYREHSLVSFLVFPVIIGKCLISVKNSYLPIYEENLILKTLTAKAL